MYLLIFDFIGLSITEDIAEHMELDDSSHILFEATENERSAEGVAEKLRKRLEKFLEKPTQIWNVPNELSSHPSTCKFALDFINLYKRI